MFQSLKENQSGAALMIVLFVVVLVSIVGTAMLSTTTYGLQNVVKTTKEQEEFYRAEGALEIVLTEMANYKNDSTGNTGPFAYLKDMTNGTKSTKSYRIGERDISVNISYKDISTQKLEVTLEAKYADNSQSKISRKMTFKVDVNYNPLPKTKTAYGFVNQEHYIDKEQFAEGIKDNIMQINYDQIIQDLGIKWSDYSSSITNQSLSNDGTYTFPTGTTKLKEISISGSGNTITIPSGAIVYVQTVTLGGNGNDTTQLTIDGALITERINHKGNSVLTLDSGLVAKYYNGTSNEFKVEGVGLGIDCSLLSAACKAINGSETTNQYTSTPNPASIKFSTNR